MRNILIVLALSVLSLSAFGQTSRGTVTGTVTDATGAVISGASVTLTNTGTNLTRSTVTNKEGFYRFDAVDLGDYKVKIAAQGFADITKTNILVTANQTANINSQLSIGTQELVVDVTSETGTSLQTETVVRGGNIDSKRIMELPFQNLNPTQLALTLPGVSTERFGFSQNTYSINGSRGRSNNFMIDGTENNDISVAGQAFDIKIPDAVVEVSVQTSNFDAEFGRAGGGVFNTITKSGTNKFHGTASWRYDSTRDDAITNIQSLDPAIQKRGYAPYGTEHTFTGTVGGPIIKDRTFFFGAFMNQRLASNQQKLVFVPTQAGRDQLRQLFAKGANVRVDNFLDYTNGVIGTSGFNNIELGGGRPAIQFGNAVLNSARTITQPQLITRIDHKISDKSQLSGRYLFDKTDGPIEGTGVSFPGFITGFTAHNHNLLISEAHTFSPSVTNEFRISYNRIEQQYPLDSTSPLSKTLPSISIDGITNLDATSYSYGVSSGLPQGRIANNYIIQDTITKIFGNHTFRAGTDLLWQRARQASPFNSRGALAYNSSGDYSGLANYIDDFGGGPGQTFNVQRAFGNQEYYPSFFRQSYFVQDRWKVSQELTVTLGLRYEFFGNPINTLKTPAFTGLFNVDPNTLKGPYSEPNSVKSDTNNFSPTVGIAYTPSFKDGFFGTLFGDQKTVFRTGYQIGYDAFFNNMASNANASSPNNIVTNILSSSNGRGLANLSSYFPVSVKPLTPFDGQTLVDPNLRNPYTQRWSFGIQRELPSQFMLDMSYVGTKGTKLYMNEDRNPLVPAQYQVNPAGNYTPSGRLDGLQGARTVRGNAGSSIYHAAQLQLTRRFTNNFTVTGSYTWSKLIDNASEVFSSTGLSNSNVSQLPLFFGGERDDRAVSMFDRTHRASFTYVYTLPYMKDQKGVLGQVVGGWQLSGITSFESGVPYTVFNGLDANGFGGRVTDRPDYNPNGQAGVRATIATKDSPSTTGYVNRDIIIGKTATGNNIYAPIDPRTARYIQLPANYGRGGTAGRNTERTKGINNFDFNVQKQFKLTEGLNLQFRTEFFNVFNHPQYGTASVSPFAPSTTGPSANINTAPAGQFLEPQYGDGGGRVIRYYLKLTF